MSKLKFAWVLPCVQLSLAIILLDWGPPSPLGFGPHATPATLLCYGISAPALVVKALGAPFRMMAIGFDLEKYLFLLGVVILWYLVGRALDAQLRPNLLIETRFVKLGRTLWDFALILSGLAFFIGGLSDRNGLAQDWSDKKTHVVISLCFIWAAVLILFPLRGLILRFHRMRSPLCSEDVRNQ